MYDSRRRCRREDRLVLDKPSPKLHAFGPVRANHVGRRTRHRQEILDVQHAEAAWILREIPHRTGACSYHPAAVHLELHQLRIGPAQQQIVAQRPVRKLLKLEVMVVIRVLQPYCPRRSTDFVHPRGHALKAIRAHRRHRRLLYLDVRKTHPPRIIERAQERADRVLHPEPIRLCQQRSKIVVHPKLQVRARQLQARVGNHLPKLRRRVPARARALHLAVPNALELLQRSRRIRRQRLTNGIQLDARRQADRSSNGLAPASKQGPPQPHPNPAGTAFCSNRSGPSPSLLAASSRLCEATVLWPLPS